MSGLFFSIISGTLGFVCDCRVGGINSGYTIDGNPIGNDDDITDRPHTQQNTG